MKKRVIRKLVLSKETVTNLDDKALDEAKGGTSFGTCDIRHCVTNYFSWCPGYCDDTEWAFCTVGPINCP